MIRAFQKWRAAASEWQDGFNCGAEARRLSEAAEKYREDAALLRNMNESATPISEALRECNDESAAVLDECADQSQRLHDAYFRSNKDRPGFREGYEAD